MNDWLPWLQQALSDMSGWEMLAVALALSYLILAVRESIYCWYAAFASTLIYTVLFWNVSLLMESALQIYYLAMAVYGWYQWRYQLSERAQQDDDQAIGPSEIKLWLPHQHFLAISTILLASAISGSLLSMFTDAAQPFLDSFTTWGSIVTTYMVTKKILENWIYWLIIDSVSLYLYLDRGLHLTALLFVAYLIICLFGLITWSREYRTAAYA